MDDIKIYIGYIAHIIEVIGIITMLITIVLALIRFYLNFRVRNPEAMKFLEGI